MLCTVPGNGFTGRSTLKLSKGLELKDFYCALWLVEKLSSKLKWVDCLGQDLCVPMTPSMERINACDLNLNLIKIVETVEQKSIV